MFAAVEFYLPGAAEVVVVESVDVAGVELELLDVEVDGVEVESVDELELEDVDGVDVELEDGAAVEVDVDEFESSPERMKKKRSV